MVESSSLLMLENDEGSSIEKLLSGEVNLLISCLDDEHDIKKATIENK